MEKLIKTIFAPHCSVCGSYGAGLCRKCLAKCRVVTEETCIICDKPSFSGSTHVLCTSPYEPASLFCSFVYEDIVRAVIRVSKYNQKEFYALKKLASSGALYASKCGVDYSEKLVIPIPLSQWRLRERGFNQSEVIAKEFCKEFGLQMDTNVLFRTKATQVQAKLSRQQRAENLKDAFAVKDTKSIQNRQILLVDDICTTGSTFISAAQALLMAGAKQVHCFALAKKVI